MKKALIEIGDWFGGFKHVRQKAHDPKAGTDPWDTVQKSISVKEQYDIIHGEGAWNTLINKKD